MAKIVWDAPNKHFYETGVKNAVLYVKGDTGYGTGVAWNGITGITESPSGAEATPLYADDQKYLNLMSVEEFGATVEAYTYPDEFAECDGSAELMESAEGITIGQQTRKTFGLAYKTTIGNENNAALGYKIHIIYGATATPSEKAYTTINDSPEAITFSWTLNTVPENVTKVEGKKATASLIIDSTKVSSANLKKLEDKLFGVDADEEHSIVEVTPTLLTPDEIITLLTTVG